MPESRKVPLVLFRLFPLSVCVLTAAAFGDQAGAGELRDQQKAILTAIEDCGQCQGRLLPANDYCSACGNPVWNFQALTMADA